MGGVEVAVTALHEGRRNGHAVCVSSKLSVRVIQTAANQIVPALYPTLPELSNPKERMFDLFCRPEPLAHRRIASLGALPERTRGPVLQELRG